MENRQQQMDTFFDQYAARMNNALGDTPEVDVDSTVAAFADCFIEASPKGVQCGQNDDQFREAVPKGLEFYRNIGTQSMQIRDKTITVLDDYHCLVKVAWQAVYRKADDSRDVIDFEVIYFVQVLDNVPKIFAYITGDEEQTYKDHGLLPE